MKVVLQMGYGMGKLAIALMKQWGGGTAVFSPRDMSEKNLINTAKKIRSLNGTSILLDPQIYDKSSDHPRLTEHAYWPTGVSTEEYWKPVKMRALLEGLQELNTKIGSKELLLPAELVTNPNELWRRRMEMMLTTAGKLSGKPALRLSVPISHKVLEDAKRVATLGTELEALVRAKGVRRAYIVPEHPPGGYYCESSEWIEGVLNTVATLAQSDVNCIVGYANQQMLVCAAAGADSIALGNWNNSRRFSLDKFSDQPKQNRRTTEWLYLNRSLSEVKAGEIVRAEKKGVLNVLQRQIDSPSGEIKSLLKTGKPDIYLPRQIAFFHYIDSIRKQAGVLSGSSYQDVHKSVLKLLASAQVAINDLTAAGIDCDVRAFGQCIDSSIIAMKNFDKARGPTFRLTWK